MFAHTSREYAVTVSGGTGGTGGSGDLRPNSICGPITYDSSTLLQRHDGEFSNSSLAFAKNGNLVASAYSINPLLKTIERVVVEIDPAVPGKFTKFPAKLLERHFAIAADGTFYSSDGNIIRKTTASGLSTILAGPEYVTSAPTLGADGTGSMARFDRVNGIAVNAKGDVYVSDSGGATIRKVSSTGVVTTIAGNLAVPVVITYPSENTVVSTGGDITGAVDGTGRAALFGRVDSIVVDSAGNIFAADSPNHAIRKITPQGVVTTVVGKLGVAGYAVGALPGVINSPQALGIDASDVLHFISVTSLNNKPAVEILKAKL